MEYYQKVESTYYKDWTGLETRLMDFVIDLCTNQVMNIHRKEIPQIWVLKWIMHNYSCSRSQAWNKLTEIIEKQPKLHRIKKDNPPGYKRGNTYVKYTGICGVFDLDNMHDTEDTLIELGVDYDWARKRSIAQRLKSRILNP